MDTSIGPGPGSFAALPGPRLSSLQRHDVRRRRPFLGGMPMKLTRASSYALGALVHMARAKSDTPVASHHIAQVEDSPERFLLKVLKPLVDAGLLRSVTGPHGGYTLARPAKEISLLEVVEAVDGPIRGQVSVFAKAKGDALARRLQAACDEAAETVRDRLGKVSLADLAGKK